ncbi:MAG: glycosyl hydrolase family 17 protein [Pseudomonadota bacterium]
MRYFYWVITALLLTACGKQPVAENETMNAEVQHNESVGLKQAAGDRVADQVMAIAYSGFRKGQHPDRGDGAKNPSRDEIREDLNILVENGFGLIRLYDARENSRMTLEIIRDDQLPIKVLQGIWLDAELSNHEGCPWLDAPIPDEQLARQTKENAAEVARGIALATEFADEIVAVNVGNEALVNWTDHLVSLDQMIAYVRTVKAAIDQPVTVAENYEWWIADGAPLAAELDFAGVHTYPAWEEKAIDEAIGYTAENMNRVHAALGDVPLAILEAGWATTASEFGGRASEANQARYYEELEAWATDANVTTFFFEAFDESWKGNPDNAEGAEKHWGVFFEDRTPKQLMRSRQAGSSE